MKLRHIAFVRMPKNKREKEDNWPEFSILILAEQLQSAHFGVNNP